MYGAVHAMLVLPDWGCRYLEAVATEVRLFAVATPDSFLHIHASRCKNSRMEYVERKTAQHGSVWFTKNGS